MSTNPRENLATGGAIVPAEDPREGTVRHRIPPAEKSQYSQGWHPTLLASRMGPETPSCRPPGERKEPSVARFLRQIFQKELEWLRMRLRSIFGKRRLSAPSARSVGRQGSRSDLPPTRPPSGEEPSRPETSSQRPGRGTARPPRVPRRATPKRPSISPDRTGPLPREIAPTPSDPFSSVVASMVLHGTLLLILIPLLIPEPEPVPRAWNVVIRLEPKEIKTVEEPDPPPIVEPVPEPNPEPQTEPETQDETDSPLDPGIEVEVEVSGIGADQGSEGSRRSGPLRNEALAHHGGNPATESAVRAGLDWLVRHQDPDGSGSPDHFDARCLGNEKTCQGPGYPEHRAGITALALLALLGDGHLPDSSEDPLDTATTRSLQWLLEHQDSQGCIRTDLETGSRNMYDHGIAAFALCETAQLTADPKIEEAARKAIRFLESSQQAGGGWDYTPSLSLRNDLSITGWQVLAIHAGIEAGIFPQKQTLTAIGRYLDRAIGDGGHATYSDRGRGRGRGGFGIDAVGLITLLALGHSPVAERNLICARRIAEHGPRPEDRRDWDQHPQSMYFWYTGTLALFHIGGEPWSRWNRQLQEKVLPLQNTSGDALGSWDPDPNWIGAAGGRVAQTALGVLTFETYFRYTPMHMRVGISRTPRDR